MHDCGGSLSTCRRVGGNLSKHNITDLLDSLLAGYNKHLRPDFGGQLRPVIITSLLLLLTRKIPVLSVAVHP